MSFRRKKRTICSGPFTLSPWPGCRLGSKSGVEAGRFCLHLKDYYMTNPEYGRMIDVIFNSEFYINKVAKVDLKA